MVSQCTLFLMLFDNMPLLIFHTKFIIHRFKSRAMVLLNGCFHAARWVWKCQLLFRSVCRDMHYCMLCLLILNRRNASSYCINIIHKQACFKLLLPLSDCFVECLPLYLLGSHCVSTVLSSLTFTFIAYYLDRHTNNCSLCLEEEKIGI
jgi:hypothetical protein